MNRHPLPPAQGPAWGPNQSGWSWCAAEVKQSWFKPSSMHSRLGAGVCSFLQKLQCWLFPRSVWQRQWAKVALPSHGDTLMLTLLLEGAN